MRERIWTSLVNLKFKVFYIDLLIGKYQRLERIINVSLAIASSSSIAAWAIWDIIPWFWASLVALSNVINVAKPYFTFGKYVKELNEKYILTQDLQLELEKLLYNFDNKRVKEDYASEYYFTLKNNINKALRTSNELITPRDEKLIVISNKRMKTYLKNEYNVDIQLI
jgi:hypothetical protein